MEQLTNENNNRLFPDREQEDNMGVRVYSHIVNISTQTDKTEKLETRISVLEIDDKHLNKKIEILDIENKILTEKVEVLNVNIINLNNQIISLKTENEIIKNENQIIRKDNKSLFERIEDLEIDKQNMKYSNLLSDIFGYFRDHVLRNKLKEIKYDKIISNALKSLCENDNILTDEEVNEFKEKLLLIGFKPDIVIELYDKNAERNNGTHFIKSRFYKDTQKMNEFLNKFEKEFTNLDNKYELYYLKNEILDFMRLLKY